MGPYRSMLNAVGIIPLFGLSAKVGFQEQACTVLTRAERQLEAVRASWFNSCE